jgi:hypothetical protein
MSQIPLKIHPIICYRDFRSCYDIQTQYHGHPYQQLPALVVMIGKYLSILLWGIKRFVMKHGCNHARKEARREV